MNTMWRPEEIQRKQRDFIEWSNKFYPLLSKLHAIGFKGYLIKKDGTIETLMHEHVQKEIDTIHEYIQAKAKEIFYGS